MKYLIDSMFLLLLFLFSTQLHAAENPQCNCIILLDHDNWENVGHPDSWFLTTKLQSAIAEQTSPILLNISLWNSFIERRTNFEQKLMEKNSPLYKTYDLYCAINEKLAYWSRHYNGLSNDACQNKKLVIQHINKEFYHDNNNITDENFQLLLNYCTAFDARDWDIYKNQNGFYLFIPKKCDDQHASLGFKIDSLEKVTYPEDSPSVYFDSRDHLSIVDALPDFFLTHDDLVDEKMSYSWNIILTGHGGSIYKETNDNQSISWIGKPIIADLDVQEFKGVLDFFQSKVNTNLFHYSSCYAGGNHIPLIFNQSQKEAYHFAIICDTLTDSANYCKWTNLLPSDQKEFLTTVDLAYDPAKNCWQLPLTPVYEWEKFFKSLATIDFSIASIEHLEEIMTFITPPIIANIPLLCLPGTYEFFPLQSSDVIKIDDRLVAAAENEFESILVCGIKTLLLESSSIEPMIVIDQADSLRIISIKPDNAVHYIKKLQAMSYIDLPSAFWQSPFQYYDKTFLIEECEFPYSGNSEIFKEPSNSENQIVLKNLIVFQQKCHFIRIFFTYNDQAMMVIANKPGQAEHKNNTTIQAVITLTSEAKEKYEKYYSSFFN